MIAMNEESWGVHSLLLYRGYPILNNNILLCA